MTGFRNVPGHGATATVSGRQVAVGNRKLMIEQDVDGMIAKVFALIEGGPASPAHFRIPCILRTPAPPRG